jgi:hypothetical protein
VVAIDDHDDLGRRTIIEKRRDDGAEVVPASVRRDNDGDCRGRWGHRLFSWCHSEDRISRMVCTKCSCPNVFTA